MAEESLALSLEPRDPKRIDRGERQREAWELGKINSTSNVEM